MFHESWIVSHTTLLVNMILEVCLCFLLLHLNPHLPTCLKPHPAGPKPDIHFRSQYKEETSKNRLSVLDI